MATDMMTGNCARCEDETGREFSCIGNFSAILCTRCRNDLYTYMMSELEFTKYHEDRMEWEKYLVSHDSVMFPSTHARFMESEWKLHKGLTEFVYGPQAMNPKPKEMGTENEAD